MLKARTAAVVGALVACAVAWGTAWAAERASQDEAVAMVKKGVAFSGTTGK